MKIPIQLVLLLCCMIVGVRGYSQDVLWEKSLGGRQADYLTDVLPTADYGFLIAGCSLSVKSGNKSEQNNGDLDYWIWKMNEKGDLEWQKNYGGSGADFLQSIALTSDGGFILGGVSNSNKGFDKTDNSKGDDDFWIVKLNAKGALEWQKTIGGISQEKLQCIKQTKDGGYIIGGSSSSSKSEDKAQDSYGNLDYWIVKLDGKGKVEWQQTYGGVFVDELRSLEQTIDGGFIVGGYSNSPVSGSKIQDNIGVGDYWILKLDTKGNIEWQKTIGGDKDDQLFVVHQTYDKSYIVGGNSNSASGNDKTKANQKGTDYWVLMLDEQGAIKWQETYSFGNIDILTSVVENEDHTFLIGGYTQGEATKNKLKQVIGKPSNTPTMKEGTDDYIALMINDKGEQLWSKTIGSSGEDLLKKVIKTRDAGYLMCGTSNSKASRDKKSNVGSNDFWVVKLKDVNKPQVVKEPLEAFPNPTSQFTNVIINYEYSKGVATLYDISGRALQSFEITGQTIPVDLSNAPQGIYIVEIKTDKGKGSVKIIKGITKN